MNQNQVIFIGVDLFVIYHKTILRLLSMSDWLIGLKYAI